MDILQALAAGEHRYVDIEVAPGVTVGFRVRKLTSLVLAEQRIQVLFTDLPADLSLLQAGDTSKDTDKIAAVRRMGPKFFRGQVKTNDAFVCAGVTGVWQPESKGVFLPTKETCEYNGETGYWRPLTFTTGKANNASTLPLTVLGQNTRDKLAAAVSAFSLDDGGIADAMRSFRRIPGDA